MPTSSWTLGSSESVSKTWARHDLLSSLPFASPRPQPALRLSACALKVHQCADCATGGEAAPHGGGNGHLCVSIQGASAGKESFVAGSQIRLPWLRHGRDRIESGLPLHLGRTRFEAARAEPRTFDVLRTCLHARPPASHRTLVPLGRT